MRRIRLKSGSNMMGYGSPFAKSATRQIVGIGAALTLTAFLAIVPGCGERFGPCKENRTCERMGAAGTAEGGSDAAGNQGGTSSTDECEHGTFSCQGQVVLQCQSGTWTQVGACPLACLGAGECGGECVPDARDCAENTPRICTQEGAWKELAACPEACSGEGNCIGQCTPESSDCLGNVPRTCKAEGEWQEAVACPFVCSGAGECTGECQPEDGKCEGNVPYLCHEAGVWIAQPACEKVCSGKGECTGACKPGDKDCSGNKPRTCTEAGEWEEAQACDFVCSGAGECTGECVPGTKACDGYGYKSCNAEGAYVRGECPTATPVCSGAGVCGGTCVAWTDSIAYDPTLVGECCTTTKGTGFLVKDVLNPAWMRCAGIAKELAMNKDVEASSYLQNHPPSNVTDQDLSSLWKASTSAANEWIRVDLGAAISVGGLVVKFEQPGAYGYELETSTNGVVWAQFVEDTPADASSLDVVFTSRSIRYVRITFTSLPAGRSAALASLRVF